jgi:hypothetical protein
MLYDHFWLAVGDPGTKIDPLGPERVVREVDEVPIEPSLELPGRESRLQTRRVRRRHGTRNLDFDNLVRRSHSRIR